MKHLDRRTFLEFVGRSSLLSFVWSQWGCALPKIPLAMNTAPLGPNNRLETFVPHFESLKPSRADQLQLAQGLEYKVLVRSNDPINRRGEKFGDNNDFLCFVPMDNNPNSGLLWVNHESINPLFVSDYRGDGKKSKKQIELEQKACGGSVLRIQKDLASGEWEFIRSSPYNRRITAQLPIPLISKRSIAGVQMAIGTVANSAGGLTPWKTVLSCEKNYQEFYPDRDTKTGERIPGTINYRWYEYFDYPPEHYGWVVEIDPLSGNAQKLTALGRFCHESATVVRASNGRCVVYMGDASAGQCLYKFIASEVGSLAVGTLYVANFEEGRWVSVDYDDQRILRKNFKDQTDVLIHTREAAKLLGGTPLHRTRDIEVDPANGSVIIALTNDISQNDFYGSLMKLEERNENPLSMSFEFSTSITGGPQIGFACPDNLAFDKAGNLWMCTDIDANAQLRSEYKAYGNNSLFFISMSGPKAGKPMRIANAPVEAKFTGPWFSSDGNTLFLSVQHPGENTKSLDAPTSHWPNDGQPKSAVVTISGPLMKSLMGS